MVKKYYQPPHIDTDTNSGKLAFNVDVDQLEDYWSAEDLKSIIEQTGTIATPVQVRMKGKNIDWTIFRVLLGERLFTFLVVNTLIRNLTLRKFAKLYPGFMNYLKSTFGDAEWNEKNIERRFGDILKEMRQVHPGTGGIFQIAYQSTNEPFQEEIRACFRRLDYSKLPDAFKNKWKELVDQDRFNEDYYDSTDDSTSDDDDDTTDDSEEDEDDDGTGSNHEDDAPDDSEHEDDDETGSNHDADAILYAELLAQSEAFLASDDTAADTTDDSIITVYSDVDRRADEVRLLELQREIAALSVSSDDNEE